MTHIERKRRILERLENEGGARVDELADELGVTKVTIRSDVAELEKRGLAVRSRGVILLPERTDLARNVTNTIHENVDAKNAIARKALELIDPNATLILDSGSTNAVLAQHLHDMELTVVTSSVPVILELARDKNISLIVSGGVLRRPSMAMVGEFSRHLYEHIHADVAFLGATGYTVEHGPSSANLLEAETKRAIIASAATTCLLVDSSKLGNRQMAGICGWDKISYMITETMDATVRSRLSELGVAVSLPDDG